MVMFRCGFCNLVFYDDNLFICINITVITQTFMDLLTYDIEIMFVVVKSCKNSNVKN